MTNKKLASLLISENAIKTSKIPMQADPELYLKQAEFERSMREEGETRYINKTQKAIQRGNEDETSYGRRIIGTQIQALAKGIKETVEHRMQSGQASRGCAATPILAEFGDWNKLAYLTLKRVVSSITKPQPMSNLCTKIGMYIEDEVRCLNLREKDKAAYMSMRKAVAKKGDYRKRRETELFINRVNEISWTAWDEKTRFKVGLVLLDTLMNSLPEFVEERILTNNTQIKGKLKTQKYICPTQETLDWIRENRDKASFFSPIYEPMVVPPIRWTSGRVIGGGYVSNNVPPLKIVKTRNNKILESFKEAKMPAVIKSLNAVQETAWRIRKPILEMLEHCYKNKIQIGSLPDICEKELPPQPDKETQPEEHKLWRAEAKAVYEHNLKLMSQAAGIGMNLKTARKYAEFDAIYMPYQLDFRGRVYCVTQLSPQGEDYVKGLLEFSEGKPLENERGVYWLFVHVANLFGVDKVSFDERVKWVQDHMTQLLDCAEDPYAYRFWEDADKPFQALAACYELQGYAKDGYDHVCRMPVALDGSCSGLQNLGMALACEVTGKSVNLLPMDKPADIYQEVANKVNVMLAEACEYEAIQNGVKTIEEVAREAVRKYYFENANKPSEKKWLNFWNKIQQPKKDRNKDELADNARKVFSQVSESYAWLKFGVDRKVCKRSVMTFPYGSKAFGFKEQIMEDTLRPARKAMSDKEWPFYEDGHNAAGVLAKFLYDAVQATVVKAAEAMDWMQQSARLVAKQQRPIKWTTPLGFPVTQDYRQLKLKMVETHLNGKRYQLSIPTESLDMDVMKSANSISPNVVHSLDASHLMLTVAMGEQEGIKSFALIHDSFGTHPSETDKFFRVIREAFLTLYTATDVFQDLKAQFEEQIPPSETLPALPSKGNLNRELILDSLYAFA
jgi:DNA-directed RNA polymerase